MSDRSKPGPDRALTFTIALPPSLRAEIAAAASKAGTSLGGWIKGVIAFELSRLRALEESQRKAS